MALSKLQQFVARYAKRVGYEIVPSWRVHELAFSRHVAEILQRYAVDVVVDVGANEGQYRDFIRHSVGFDGPIISYEPQPACYAHLVERARLDPEWHIRNFALGESRCELTLNVMKGSTLSSFLKPEKSVLGEYGGLNTVRETVQVPVVRLDEDLAASNLVKPEQRIYLKIDTQGFDLNVIRGATAAYPHIAAIQTELSMKALYEGMPRYTEVLAFMESQGFELSGIFPVNINDGLALIEADGIFINPLLTPAAYR